MSIIEHDDNLSLEQHLQLLPVMYLSRMLKEQIEHAEKRHSDSLRNAYQAKMDAEAVKTSLLGADRIRKAITDLGGIVDERYATNPIFNHSED